MEEKEREREKLFRGERSTALMPYLGRTVRLEFPLLCQRIDIPATVLFFLSLSLPLSLS